MEDVTFKLTLKTEDAKAQVAEVIFQVVKDKFELDIKAEAKDDSPKDTGNNSRSIDTEVEADGSSVKAELFTQSGYGGYLEVGTYKMPARPYLGPAFEKGIAEIADEIKDKLK